MIEKQVRRASTSLDKLDQNVQRWLWNVQEPAGERRWLSPAKLNEVVKRERDRADRRDIEFSLVVFELNNATCQAEHFDILLQVFNKRLRLTDDFGLLDPETVGVVLPDTPGEGADFVAAHIKELAEEKGVRLRSQVYVYPHFELPDQLDLPDQNGSARQPDEKFKPLFFTRPISFWSRSLDIIASASLICLLMPLLVIVGLLVKATSRGPVIFAQWREGQAGRRFKIYKFRTMRADAEHHQASLRHLSHQDGPAFKIKNDPRLTRVGSFLRRSCIDELPQLFNVLKGEMTLVGPRPLPLSESFQCSRWQRRRLDVVPGLTCFWQVYGHEGTPFVEWMRMDLRYINQAGLREDVRLILATIGVVLRRKGSH